MKPKVPMTENQKEQLRNFAPLIGMRESVLETFCGVADKELAAKALTQAHSAWIKKKDEDRLKRILSRRIRTECVVIGDRLPQYKFRLKKEG